MTGKENAGHNEQREVPMLVVIPSTSRMCGASYNLKPKIRRSMTICFVAFLDVFRAGGYGSETVVPVDGNDTVQLICRHGDREHVQQCDIYMQKEPISVV